MHLRPGIQLCKFFDPMPDSLKYLVKGTKHANQYSNYQSFIFVESPRAHWLRRALRQMADRFSVACYGVSEH